MSRVYRAAQSRVFHLPLTAWAWSRSAQFSDLRRYTELRSEMLYTMISPEEAAEAGVASAKHAAGAKVCVRSPACLVCSGALHVSRTRRAVARGGMGAKLPPLCSWTSSLASAWPRSARCARLRHRCSERQQAGRMMYRARVVGGKWCGAAWRAGPSSDKNGRWGKGQMTDAPVSRRLCAFLAGQDEEMPEGFMACPRIWKEDRNKACPYQYNHAIY